MAKTSYYIFAFSILVTLLPCVAKTSTNLTTDQSALISLKTLITLDPYRILTRNWTNSSSVCSWIGVTCGLRHHRVTALNISNMDLSGTIPPQLGYLSFLVSLDLTYNHFSGTLPQELSLLHRLKFISLRVNNFTGVIPSTIFNISTLEAIGLTSNEMSGTLPMNMCDNLPLLQALALSYNQLSGQIPSNLSHCPQLQIVSLSYNIFSGEIPATIGKLNSLTRLAIGGNKINGVIPEEIGNLQKLIELDIEKSNISGTLPHRIFNMTSLQILRLRRNNLSGGLSRDIANLTMLKDLELNENNFTGVLPAEISQLYQLEKLSLSLNAFNGSIPPELFNISTLQSLGLIGHGLTGVFPSNFCYGTPLLQKLYLAKNNMSGPIPSSISSCPHLKILELSFNRFTGIVPHSLSNLTFLEIINLRSNNLRIESTSSELTFITSLTNCRSLRYLTIADNPLYGIIPSSIGNFSSSLQYFFAYNCKIKGGIPSSIGNLTGLILLSLFENELSGNIPCTLKNLHKLQGLALGSNNLDGLISHSLCNLNSINLISLGENQLSGPIPECFGNITSLRSIRLDSNKLTSSIPSSFWRHTDFLQPDLSLNSLSGILPTTIGKLQNLIYLSLAHNRLEGSIPESAGSMISLITLDLSYNNLSGSIPKSFVRLQQLDKFNVSFNALSGEIPSDGPFKNFTMESFKENKALCGIPRFHVPLCRTLPHRRSRTKKLKFSLLILVGVVALITIVSVAFIFLRYRKKNKTTFIIGELVHSTTLERISYYEILESTVLFNESNLLGIGSFGSVYKGIRKDGKVIAVKVFNLQTEAAFRSFDVECNVLRNIRHRNLTAVISSCSNKDFRALVLEYMPMGNLEKWLYSHNYCLDVLQRLNVMIDVACGLEYLHHGNSIPIVHCDLKPSNVLLDEEMVAHVSDFGIAKFLGDGGSIVLTDTLATPGYIAPEYGFEGLVSKRCDVYSYGIMLLETFTRKRPTDDMFGGDLSLKSWVERLLPHSLDQVMDPNLLTNLDDEHCDKIMHCAFSILVVALKCSTDSPTERISMKEALIELQKVKRQFF